MATIRGSKKVKKRSRPRKAPSVAQGKPESDNLQSDEENKTGSFTPKTLDRTVIAIPLLLELERAANEPGKVFSIIIDLNLMFPGGKASAKAYVDQKIERMLRDLKKGRGEQGLRSKGGAPPEGPIERHELIEQYLFAKLSGDVIRRLVREDGNPDEPLKKELLGDSRFSRAIYHVWPDFPVRRLTNHSFRTVKADAAHASFSAFGEGIVWAVLDSGIYADHLHFKMHDNLDLQKPLVHMDFTGGKNTRTDPHGHGTHVGGIIAGEVNVPDDAKARDKIYAAVRNRNEQGETEFSSTQIKSISGMAPKCKLLNMRVLDEQGSGEVSSIIAAIAKIQEINGYGRHLLIHGVNLSIGNDFEPEWFACGQSPLCVEVNRLVKSGVVVVVAAGNSGYGSLKTEFTGTINTGIGLTINDPGNADLAITVGATHRDMPHTYGVSYFSSKGPTGDGRLKPDLVAPGEKIISCASGKAREDAEGNAKTKYEYVEDSGTSMAAPHVSGVIAAFLSVRREFIGYPEQVKQIFMSTATDLKREKYFQGSGLVDLMRAIQSV